MNRIDFYKFKKDAFDVANEWDSVKDKHEYYEREFCKPYHEYLAKYLINKGAFTIKLNDVAEDEKTFEGVKFLLDNSRKFGFKKWFVNFLSNIKPDNLYYVRTVEMQNGIDKVINGLVQTINYEHFVKKILAFLNNIDWGGSEFDKGDYRTTENSQGLYIVEATTYLIKRSALFAKNDNHSEGFQEDNVDYNELFNETLRFMYAKQKIYEMCLFGASNYTFFFRKKFKASSKFENMYSGIIFQGLYEMQVPESVLKSNNSEKLDSFLLSHYAKMLGLQSNDDIDRFLSLKIVDGLTFYDLLEPAYRINKYSKNIDCEETTMSDKMLNYLLINAVLKKTMVAKPCELIDLYQTPFLNINGEYYHSKNLLLHCNLLTNVITSLMKQKTNNLLEQKGVNFETQVFDLLNGQVAELKHSIKFSSKGSVVDLVGDIDIAALENGTLYIIECKSEFTSLDYYDYRRELDIIDRASLQLDKIMAFLHTEEGKNLLKRKFASDVSSCEIFPCIVVSNCRTSYIEDNRYPIYSLFELELARKNGNFEFEGIHIQFKPEKIKDSVFDSLKERNVAKEIKDSIMSKDISVKTKGHYKMSMEEFNFDRNTFIYKLNKKYNVPRKLKIKYAKIFLLKIAIVVFVILFFSLLPSFIKFLKCVFHF